MHVSIFTFLYPSVYKHGNLALHESGKVLIKQLANAIVCTLQAKFLNYCQSRIVTLKKNLESLTTIFVQVPMVTTESGLQYKDIKIGEGPSPPIGFQVAFLLSFKYFIYVSLYFCMCTLENVGTLI